MTFRIEGNQDSNYPKKQLHQQPTIKTTQTSIFQAQNYSSSDGVPPAPTTPTAPTAPTQPNTPTAPNSGEPLVPPDPNTPAPTAPTQPDTPTAPNGGEPLVPPDPNTPAPTAPTQPDTPTAPNGGEPLVPSDPTEPESGINSPEVNNANTGKTQKRMLKAGAPLPQGDGIKIYDMSGRLVTGETATRSGMYIIKKE